MTRNETYFSGHLTWDGWHFLSHHVFALFLKSFFKLLFNTKGRNQESYGFLCPQSSLRMHRDLFLIAPFSSSMIQETHCTALLSALLFSLAWCGCPSRDLGSRSELSPSLSAPSSAPRAFHFCVFRAHFSCTFCMAPSIQQPGLDTEEPGKKEENGLNFKIFKEKNGVRLCPVRISKLCKMYGAS